MTDEQILERDMRAALQPLIDAAEHPRFEWHSTTVEGGELCVMFNGPDESTWMLTGRPADGAPMRFERVA